MKYTTITSRNSHFVRTTTDWPWIFSQDQVMITSPFHRGIQSCSYQRCIHFYPRWVPVHPKIFVYSSNIRYQRLSYIHLLSISYSSFWLQRFLASRNKTGWWFQIFSIFHNIWDTPSHWLSYFSRWLKPPTRKYNY